MKTGKFIFLLMHLSLICAMFSCSTAYTQVISTFAGNGTPGSTTGNTGPATAASISVQNLARDASGNIYSSDPVNHVIRKITPSGSISIIAGSLSDGTYGGDGGPATAATMSPYGIAIDGAGNIFFSEYSAARIRKINTSGIVTTIAGTGAIGFSGDGGPATAAKFGNIIPGLAVDASGNVYVADLTNYRIRKISTSGIISTVAGTGIPTPFLGNGIAATASNIYAPSSVAVDGAGNIYFTEPAGLKVKKITPAGLIYTVAGNGSCCSTADTGIATASPLNTPSGVAIDAGGNVYITSSSNHVVRRVDAVTGRLSALAGTGVSGFSGDGGLATAATLNAPYGLLFDNNGDLLVADKNNNRIRKVSCTQSVAAISGASSVCSGASISLTDATAGGTWRSGAISVATVNASGVVTGVSAGAAIISYSVSNSCNTTTVTKTVTVNAVPAVATITGSNTVCVGANLTLANTTTGGTWSSSSTAVASVTSGGVVRGNAAGTASISYSVTNTCGTARVIKAVTVNAAPVVSAITGTSAVAVGASVSLTSSGTTWSSSNTSVATVNATTGVVTGVSAGMATISCGATNTCGTTYATLAIGVGTSSNNYVISSVAGNGTSGFSGDGGAATAATMSYPYAVAITNSGVMYIADQVNNRIRKVTAAGIISTIAGNGGYGNTGDGGAATAATLANPTGVAVDAAGNLYVADYGNNRIRKISTSGIISNFAGSGIGLDGGPATAADVYHPSGVAVDASGNVFIAETGNNKVRKVTTAGIISTIAGTGVSGYSGDGAAATAAKLSSPVGVCTDASGNVYIADLGNNRMRKVTSAGIISTVAGNGVAGFSGDGGAATSAKINTPYGMTIDVLGNMYICDYNNFRVRKVSNTGVMTTIAGNSTGAFGGDGGAATSANLNRPTGIAVDGSGNIYIADVNNQRVRKLVPCSLPVSGIISGPSTVIVGNNITLASTGTGGAWSSVFTSKATVSTSGMVHAIAAGVDTIKYTVTNTCGTARSVYVLNITSSKPEGSNAITATEPVVLNVYPNPSNGVLTLETSQDRTISTVLVFNISGKMLQQVNGSGSTQQVDISNYATGMYILKVLHDNGEISQVRVVKE